MVADEDKDEIQTQGSSRKVSESFVMPVNVGVLLESPSSTRSARLGDCLNLVEKNGQMIKYEKEAAMKSLALSEYRAADDDLLRSMWMAGACDDGAL